MRINHAKNESIKKQASLKDEANQILLELVIAQLSVCEAVVNICRLSRQEQVEFCGPFHLQAQIDGDRWWKRLNEIADGLSKVIISEDMEPK